MFTFLSLFYRCVSFVLGLLQLTHLELQLVILLDFFLQVDIIGHFVPEFIIRIKSIAMVCYPQDQSAIQEQ